MGGTFSRRGHGQGQASEEEEAGKTEVPQQNGTTPQSTSLDSVALRDPAPKPSPMFDDTQKNWVEDGT